MTKEAAASLLVWLRPRNNVNVECYEIGNTTRELYVVNKAN